MSFRVSGKSSVKNTLSELKIRPNDEHNMSTTVRNQFLFIRIKEVNDIYLGPEWSTSYLEVREDLFTVSHCEYIILAVYRGLRFSDLCISST
jgi:hypothetical protein